MKENDRLGEARWMGRRRHEEERGVHAVHYLHTAIID